MHGKFDLYTSTISSRESGRRSRKMVLPQPETCVRRSTLAVTEHALSPKSQKSSNATGDFAKGGEKQRGIETNRPSSKAREGISSDRRKTRAPESGQSDVCRLGRIRGGPVANLLKPLVVWGTVAYRPGRCDSSLIH